MRCHGRPGGTGGTQMRHSGSPPGKEALNLAGTVYLASVNKLHDQTGKDLGRCTFRLDIEENFHI